MMSNILTDSEQRALLDVSDGRRPAWVVADNVQTRAELESSVEAGGFRTVRRFSIAEALETFGQRTHGTLVALDIGEGAAPMTAQLLDRIDRSAVDCGGSAIVSFPPDAIDDVTAAVSAPFASLLCAPSFAERIAAAGLADVPAAWHFAEIDSAVDTMRLQQLAEEVGRIARALAGYAEPGAAPASVVSDGLIGYRAGPAPIRPGATQTVRAEDIRSMIRLRRQRERLFAGELFADPAWDMILDLMAAKIERLKVAVSSLCIAAAVPPTTALRWIRTLTDLGIFVRVADPTDGRRVFIELSEAAAAKVLGYLGEVKRTGVPVV